MWIIHAVVFYIVETLRMKRERRISAWKYAIEFFPNLWTFLRLEWNDQRRDLGYAPVTISKRNYDIHKRGIARRKKQARQKAKRMAKKK